MGDVVAEEGEARVDEQVPSPGAPAALGHLPRGDRVARVRGEPRVVDPRHLRVSLEERRDLARAALAAVVARRAAWSYVLVLVVVLVHPILLGYATPAAYSYNAVYGFFPGFTYDESLHLGWRLFLFRYLTLCSAALFLLVAEFAADLEKYKTSKGTVQFAVDKPLPAALVKKFVEARVADNEAKKKKKKAMKMLLKTKR